MSRCRQCRSLLNRHNVTAWCAECKLIDRNARLSGQPVDRTTDVDPHQARDNILAVFTEGVSVIGTQP